MFFMLNKVIIGKKNNFYTKNTLKHIFFLSAFLFFNVVCTEKNCIPLYTGSGAQNVYYITGVGNNLLVGYPVLRNNQDGWSLPYIALRNAFVEKGYKFYTSLPSQIDKTFIENVYAIFNHNIPGPAFAVQLGKALDRTIILALEPFHVMPQNYNPSFTKYFKKILTWDDTRIDNKQFFKYFFVQSTLEMISDIVPFKDKKLCTLIGSNKNFQHPHELYSQRRKVIAFFEGYAPNDFDFYGHGWDKRIYKTFKGPVRSKTNTFRKYKFSICYENIANTKGYITEKIFGSFIAGCVPIYWGADNITDYIPANCFIDKRQFSDFKKLYTFISSMTEEEYNQYLENIRIFLASEEAQKYSIDYFVKTLTDLLCA